jgi:hypothetical protein
MEQWKDVVGYEGFYEVSNLGRVRNTKTGLLKKLSPNHHDYLKVKLGTKSHFVHRLVAAAWVGPRPAGCDVNHKDHCRQNNRAENLEWVTRLGNSHHAMNAGRLHRGEQITSAKLTTTQVLEIRSAVGCTRKELAEKYGVGRQQISKILLGRLWTHV